jgi:exosome complex component RRP45
MHFHRNAVLLDGALDAGLRLDGRSLYDWRSVEIRLWRNEKQATSEIVIGNTRVIGITRASITVPFVDRPNDGYIQFSTVISPQTKRSKWCDGELTRFLERFMKESDVIDTESLCIVSGEKVWNITCSITVIDNDGNLPDAVILAAMSSLRCFRKPDVTLTRSTDLNSSSGLELGSELSTTMIHIHPFREREPLPLAFNHFPLSSTIAIYLNKREAVLGKTSGSCILFVDPCIVEENSMDSCLIMGVNSHGEITSVLKHGGGSLSKSDVLDAVKKACKNIHYLHEKLEKEILNFEVNIKDI